MTESDFTLTRICPFCRRPIWFCSCVKDFDDEYPDGDNVETDTESAEIEEGG